MALSGAAQSQLGIYVANGENAYRQLGIFPTAQPGFGLSNNTGYGGVPLMVVPGPYGYGTGWSGNIAAFPAYGGNLLIGMPGYAVAPTFGNLMYGAGPYYHGGVPYSGAVPVMVAVPYYAAAAVPSAASGAVQPESGAASPVPSPVICLVKPTDESDDSDVAVIAETGGHAARLAAPSTARP